MNHIWVVIDQHSYLDDSQEFGLSLHCTHCGVIAKGDIRLVTPQTSTASAVEEEFNSLYGQPK